MLTYEAQQRARTFDKIETANRALECIDSALRVYPDQPELHESKVAIGEFVASIKVAHWVELAERSAFKGHYRRAIDRYRDALFYLNQDVVKPEVRAAGTQKIEQEIAAIFRPDCGSAKIRINDFSEVSQVWKFKDSQGIQAHAAADASGWHLPPFVRSLQLAFYRVCLAWDLQSTTKASPAKEKLDREVIS